MRRCMSPVVCRSIAGTGRSACNSSSTTSSVRRLALLVLFAASPAVAQTVTVDQSACRLATPRVRAADVKKNPGRDAVTGKGGAPADISPPLQGPKNFQIVTAVDAAKKLQALGGTATNPNQYG